jgi:hypothetical protein
MTARRKQSSKEEQDTGRVRQQKRVKHIYANEFYTCSAFALKKLYNNLSDSFDASEARLDKVMPRENESTV